MTSITEAVERPRLRQKEVVEMVKSLLLDRGLPPPTNYFPNYFGGRWGVTTHFCLQVMVDDSTGEVWVASAK